MIPATAIELINKQQALQSELDEYELIINKARRGNMGLTLEEDKTPEWRWAKKMHFLTWAKYQQVNKELAKLRKFKRYELVDGKRVAVYIYK